MASTPPHIQILKKVHYDHPYLLLPLLNQDTKFSRTQSPSFDSKSRDSQEMEDGEYIPAPPTLAELASNATASAVDISGSRIASEVPVHDSSVKGGHSLNLIVQT